MTEAGKALHRALCGFSEPHGCHHKDGIARLESAARAIGAQQERSRLVAKAKLDHHTKRDHPDHRHPWGYCENARCRDRYDLLSDPQPDALVAEPTP